MTFLAVLPPAAVLLSQEGTGTPTTVMGAFIVVCLSVVGLLSWIIRHIFITALPDLTKAFKESVDAVAKQGEGLRESFERRHDSLLQHCEGETEKERTGSERRFQSAMEQFRASQQELVSHLTGLAEQLREALHNLRNVRTGQQRANFQAEVAQQATVAIYTKSLDGIVMAWNAHCEQLFGWKPEEMIGQNVRKMVPPDQEEEERERLKRVRKGEATPMRPTERLHKDGHTVRVLLSTNPLRDATTQQLIGATSVAIGVPESEGEGES